MLGELLPIPEVLVTVAVVTVNVIVSRPVPLAFEAFTASRKEHVPPEAQRPFVLVGSPELLTTKLDAPAAGAKASSAAARVARATKRASGEMATSLFGGVPE